MLRRIVAARLPRNAHARAPVAAAFLRLSSAGIGGAHDLGGVHVDEPLDIRSESNSHHEHWELATHALLGILVSKKLLTVDELRRSIEQLPGAEYARLSYYERWASAMAKIQIERGVLSEQDLDELLQQEQPSSTRTPTIRFAPGDVVRVRTHSLRTVWAKPHIRTPGYVFGASGVVERVCGVFPYPELGAYRLRGPAQPLYRVRFARRDLWRSARGGGSAGDATDGESAADTVDVEVYQPWLEPGSELSESLRRERDGVGDVQHARHGHGDGDRSHGHGDRSHGHGQHSHGHGDRSHGDGSLHARHSHGDGNDHEHEHKSREIVEQEAVEREPAPRPLQPLAEALLAALQAKAIITGAELAAAIERVTRANTHLAGARLVARAWLDPLFKQLLLHDASAAAAELGIAASNYGKATGATVLTVVENTTHVHNVVVCTLCSCYPTAVLGLSPAWYKSAAYRARAVREPRRLLREFGVSLDESVAVRVHDSTADLRYMVLPIRPPDTQGFSEDQLVQRVTRDMMIGVRR